MAVSNISSTANPYQAADAQNSFRKDFKASGQALQSDDLTSAQQAFAALQQDNPKFAQAVAGRNSSSPTNPVSTAL